MRKQILDDIEQLLEGLAEQQAMPDDSWKKKWSKLKQQLDRIVSEHVAFYGEDDEPKDYR